jgi:hypothetical protein
VSGFYRPGSVLKHSCLAGWLVVPVLAATRYSLFASTFSGVPNFQCCGAKTPYPNLFGSEVICLTVAGTGSENNLGSGARFGFGSKIMVEITDLPLYELTLHNKLFILVKLSDLL